MVYLVLNEDSLNNDSLYIVLDCLG